MKRIVSLLLCLALVCVAFAGCQSAGGANSSTMFRIGLVQYVEHPSLNTIRESFMQELSDLGIADQVEVDYQNAQSDQSNLNSICQKFVGNNVDLIVAIATPAAIAAASATQDIPILFSAVTDPVSAKLVDSLEAPGRNVSGTSDAIPAEKILDLALEITPEIKTVGFLYNTGEPNSVSVINDAKEYLESKGISFTEAAVTNSSEVSQSAQSLVGKVEAIFTPIDNTVASAMPTLAEVANGANLPVFVGADSMVQDGGLATVGIDYTLLGRETAKMAQQIKDGQNISELPVKVFSEYSVYINETTAEEIGITIPEDILNSAVLLK